MDILAAIKREERKLEKQFHKVQHQLNGVRAAAKALGGSASQELKTVKKHIISAAGRANISRAQRRRWAKVRAKVKKIAG
jgi:predicted transcriptional regulator